MVYHHPRSRGSRPREGRQQLWATTCDSKRDRKSSIRMGSILVFVSFAGLILVMASFISHTVTAIIILPLVYTVGTGMEDPRPNLLVMGSAMMCSVAMALATSGFPNMTAISQEHKNSGEKYLRVSHFLTRGIPASLMTMVVVSTVGYGIMNLFTDM